MFEIYFNGVPLSRQDFGDTLVDRVAFDVAFTAGVHCADKAAALELLRHTAAEIIERVDRPWWERLPVAENLSETERETLTAIQEYLAQEQKPPTYRELGDRLRLSQSSVLARLRLLQAAEVLLLSTKARGIKLLKRI